MRPFSKSYLQMPVAAFDSRCGVTALAVIEDLNVLEEGLSLLVQSPHMLTRRGTSPF
jgi:hypothetical protein